MATHFAIEFRSRLVHYRRRNILISHSIYDSRNIFKRGDGDWVGVGVRKSERFPRRNLLHAQVYVNLIGSVIVSALHPASHFGALPFTEHDKNMQFRRVFPISGVHIAKRFITLSLCLPLTLSLSTGLNKRISF